ncbi:MAG TPA: dihydroorotase [Candidatus Limnocylindrales bacterium]|jgi:dihydroorotase
MADVIAARDASGTIAEVGAVAVAIGAAIGDVVDELDLERIWLVDPTAGREGVASLRVEAGAIVALEWLDDDGPIPSILVLPGFTDLHVHAREPGDEEAETVATAMAAAAHGGFTRICLMANTRPAVDTAAVVGQVRAAAAASRVPITVEVIGATTAARAGVALAPMAELADAGVVAFSDDGAPVSDSSLMRHALAYAGALGLPIVEHAEDRSLTDGAEMHEGVTATVLGLRGWPTAAEVAAVGGAIAILDEVARGTPTDAAPRLHLTHISTAATVDLIRAAKAAGLPVTCDVTPHHLVLHDGWVAGDRRWAWQAIDETWLGRPTDAPPYDPATRVNPPLRSPADAAALAAGLRDGTIDAIATDHAPHTDVAKAVEFGDAANGISGLETALGQLLAAVDGGVLDLPTVVRALTTGPARVLGSAGGSGVAGIVVGALADLVIVDRSRGWRVESNALSSLGTNTPLLGRELPGRVLATLAAGRWAWTDGQVGLTTSATGAA